jgi:hypothetical protein
MLRLVIGTALVIAVTNGAGAQQLLRIGLIQSLTGPFSAVGKAAVNGARLYLREHGDVVAGRRIELVVKDDGSAPDRAKRIAQEMIVNDKVAIIGAGITPSALAIAPLITEAKIATVIMVSGASITVDRSPYMVRTSFTLGQSSSVMADWVVKNGARKIVTIVNEWRPGPNRRLCSRTASRQVMPRSSNRCGCRSPILISRHFCNAHEIWARTPYLYFQQTRPRSLPSNLWSAAWTNQGFGWWARAI